MYRPKKVKVLNPIPTNNYYCNVFRNKKAHSNCWSSYMPIWKQQHKFDSEQWRNPKLDVTGAFR